MLAPNLLNAEKYVEYNVTENRKLSFRVVNWKNIDWIDMRQWFKKSNCDEFQPSGKGLLIELRVFKDTILPEIMKWVNG